MAQYKVVRTNERKGKTHKVIGPGGETKYFGDPNLKNKPNSPDAKSAFYARHASNLKSNPFFRAYANATWAEGGYVENYEDGGEVEEPEQETPEAEPVEADMPALKVEQMAPPPIESGVSLDPSQMSLQKQERIKLAELPDVSSNRVATSQPASGGGGGGGGGLLGKVLGFLFGAADGGAVPMHFADGGVSLSPEEMRLAVRRRLQTAILQPQSISTPGLKTSSPKTGGGKKKKETETTDPSAMGDWVVPETRNAGLDGMYAADGGQVGGFAALTNAIEQMKGQEFPQVVGGDETKHYSPVPVAKPKPLAKGGKVKKFDKEKARKALHLMFRDAAEQKSREEGGTIQSWKEGDTLYSVGRGKSEEGKYKDIPASLLNSAKYKELFEGMDDAEREENEKFILDQYRAGKKVQSAKEYEASPEFVGPRPETNEEGVITDEALRKLRSEGRTNYAAGGDVENLSNIDPTIYTSSADAEDALRRVGSAPEGEIYDRSGLIAKLQARVAELKNDEARRAALDAERVAREKADAASKQNKADLNALGAADLATEAGSEDAEQAALEEARKVSAQINRLRGAPTDRDIAANMSLADRGSVASLLTRPAPPAVGMSVAPKEDLFQKVVAGAEARSAERIAAEKAAAEKEAADKLAADEKAAKLKSDALAGALDAVKKGNATPDQRALLLSNLDELTTLAAGAIKSKFAPAATAPVSAPSDDTTGAAGDTLAPQAADALAEATLKGVGTIQEAPAPSPDLSPRLSIPDALQTALSLEATRYTPTTFADLSKLTGRVGAVYSVAKRSGFDDATARKLAIDEGVKDLQSPTLPALPSGEEAMAIARSQPEVAAMRGAAQRLAEIKLRDTELATQEAVATARLREAQTDLALAQANEFEVRRAAQMAQLDGLRNAVVNDTLNLDKFLVDAKARTSFGFFKHALAFVGTSMGGKVNPYELARSKVQQELNTQLNVIDRKRTLLGSLVQEGNSMDDAYKLAQAQLSQLFALQLQKAAAPLRDERQRLAGLEAANKLLYDAAKAQEEVVRKQVDSIYEPYKLKLQGAAGGVRDIFDYIKEGGDLEQLRQRLVSDAADRAVRRGELGVRKEEAQLKREELQVKAAGNALTAKLLSGQPLANAGEYASVVSSNPELRKALIKPVVIDPNGKVQTGQGYLLARSEKAAEDLSEFRKDTERSLDLLDRMEGLLAANRYNYRAMTTADQGAFRTARDEFIAALGSKAARNVGVPSDAEYSRLADSVPEPGYFNSEDFAKGKLKEFRRIFTTGLQRIYNNNLYTAGQTPAATSQAKQEATFKVRSKSNPSQIVSVPRQQALDMLKGPGGNDLEILP